MSLAETDIIIVDDDLSMSQAIERLLSAAGWRARSFASAEALLASEACAAAAIIIVDIHLPGISGLELARRLVADAHPIAPPVIFITAQDRPATRDQARRAGGVAYFTKPFAGGELIREIRRHLPSPAA